MSEELRLALVQLDSAKEAWQEYSESFAPMNPERKSLVQDEIDTRLEAVKALVQIASGQQPHKHGLDMLKRAEWLDREVA